MCRLEVSCQLRGTDSEMHGDHGEGDVEEWRDLELWGYAENLKMACEASLTQMQQNACQTHPSMVRLGDMMQA